MKRKTSRLLSLLLTLSMVIGLLPGTALAVDSEVSGKFGDGNALTWTLDTSGNLTISGSGAMPNYSSSTGEERPWDAYYGEIKNITIDGGVTRIGSYAFNGYQSLYYNLNSVTIHNGVQTIGSAAFTSCGSLKVVDIPSSVTTIESYAFSNTGLTEVAIPEGVTTVGGMAFYNCTRLVKATIPSTITSLGTNIFQHCDMLSDVTIAEGITTIGQGMFRDCSSLKSITIPSTVTSIGSSAFEDCIKLTSVDIPSRVTTIKSSAFFGSGLTSVTIPDSVTTIEGLAFQHTNLTSVEIPSSVTSLGYSAFQNCMALERVKINYGLTSIGKSTFNYCISMTEIEIPASVTSIGSYAFATCRSLTTITYTGTEDDWAQIDIDWTPDPSVETINNDVLRTANIVCLGTEAPPEASDSEPKIAEIQGMSPTPGTRDVEYKGDWVSLKFQITFDRPIIQREESSEYQKWADVDLDALGALKIFRADDNTLVYPDEANGHGYTNGSFRIDEENTLVISPENTNTLFEPGTEYYITMGVGFVNLGDGYTNPAITPGEWTFATKSDGSAPLMEPKSGAFYYSSMFSSPNAEYTYYYDESWFLDDSTEYKHELAKMSIAMAMAAFDVGGSDRAANIKNLFGQLGFSYTATSVVYPVPDLDSIGYAIGSKKIYDENNTFTLIAVAVRGAGYGNEWASNVTVGESSEHSGFANAASTVTAAVKSYIETLNISGDIKIWLTGYSRAAATANITAQRLTALAKSGQIRGLSVEGIYAYCFECPQNVRTDDPSYKENIYKNIHNIANYIDIVTKVAPKEWNFSRYGITYYLPSAEQTGSFSNAYNRMLDTYADIISRAGMANSITVAKEVAAYAKGQGFTGDDIVDGIAKQFGNQSIYAIGHQRQMRSIWAGFDDGMDVAALVGEVAGEVPGFIIFHPILFGELLGNAINFYHAHFPELCLAWMNTITGKNDFVDSRTRKLMVNCPVNIEVYDSKSVLVAQILDDTVIEVANSTIATYIDEDGQKVIVLPVDEEYTVKLVATDDGTVTYTATEYNIDTADTVRVVSYYAIDVIKEDKLIGRVENLEEESAVYPLYLNNSEKSLETTIDQKGDEVVEYDVTVSASGNGIVSGGGSYVNGEFAKVTAEADSGETFLGWYIKSELVSSELEYRFLVDNDVEIVARFTTNTSQSPGTSNGTPSSTNYQITASTTENGTVTITPKSAKSGEKVTITAKPDDGYAIGSVTVTDSSGKSVTVTDNGDGTYTFTMPSSKVTVDVTFVPAGVGPWINPFTDVSESDWFYNDVAYVVQNGLMVGVGNQQFNPGSTTTRGMIMTILARLDGANTSGGDPWYQPGMEWAITEGVSDGTRPEGEITREQFVTMLWRYAGEPAATGDLSAYPDADKIHDWASDAMAWAVENGIIVGSGGKLEPQSNALRSQAAALLTRFCKNIVK